MSCGQTKPYIYYIFIFLNKYSASRECRLLRDKYSKAIIEGGHEKIEVFPLAK